MRVAKTRATATNTMATTFAVPRVLLPVITDDLVTLAVALRVAMFAYIQIIIPEVVVGLEDFGLLLGDYNDDPAVDVGPTDHDVAASPRDKKLDHATDTRLELGVLLVVVADLIHCLSLALALVLKASHIAEEAVQTCGALLAAIGVCRVAPTSENRFASQRLVHGVVGHIFLSAHIAGTSVRLPTLSLRQPPLSLLSVSDYMPRASFLAQTKVAKGEGRRGQIPTHLLQLLLHHLLIIHGGKSKSWVGPL